MAEIANLRRDLVIENLVTEGDKMGFAMEKAMSEADKMKAEAERLKAEVDMMQSEVKKLKDEAESLKSNAEMILSWISMVAKASAGPKWYAAATRKVCFLATVCVYVCCIMYLTPLLLCLYTRVASNPSAVIMYMCLLLPLCNSSVAPYYPISNSTVV